MTASCQVPCVPVIAKTSRLLGIEQSVTWVLTQCLNDISRMDDGGEYVVFINETLHRVEAMRKRLGDTP